MKIIFLGYMVPLEEMHAYSGISVAGNKMQYNIVNELNKMSDVDVCLISMEPYAHFPLESKVFVRQKNYVYQDILCTQVRYCNLPILKQITQIFSVYKVATNLIRQFKKRNEEVVVLGFNMFPQIGVPMRRLKKHTKQVCLLADLPLDDDINRKGFSKVLRKFFDFSTRKNMSFCDNYIVLSEYVKTEILNGKNVIVVEGGINDDEIVESISPLQSNEKTVILFSGALTDYNGITNLIESMRYINEKDIEVRIFGNGYLKEYVELSQEVDQRIKYCGQVSNEEMRKYQREADVLINPRQVDNPISKYTFPSKTFEYFLSKTIVISTRIPSYSEEYLDKMIIAEDSPEGLAMAIKQVINMSKEDKRIMEDNAYRFVIDRKRWSLQTKKIYDFITKIE